MFIEKAYAQRDTLADAGLERLLASLKDEVERYRYVVRNDPPDRMEQFGKPFLAMLEERVVEVQRLVSERASRSK